LFSVIYVQDLVNEVCLWASDNPVSAGAIAIVIVYTVFRALSVRPGRSHVPG